jgi:hypothetical protein
MHHRPHRSKRTKKAGLTDNTGQQGINLVEQYVLQMGFVWNQTRADQGIDGSIEIVETATRTATNRIVQVQVKATTREFQSETPSALSFTCDPADIDYWLRGNAPVILIVCQPRTRHAYWKDVNAYFLDPKNQKTNTVRFDKKSDRFDASTGPLLANLAKPNGGLHLGPLPKKETLISNLFPVAAYPRTIWSAISKHRSRDEFGQALKNLPPGNSHLREFFLNGDTIYSFLDLNKHPLNTLIEPGTVETNSSDDWALTDDPDLKYKFVQLLNICLTQFCYDQKITFNRENKIHYFMWESKTGSRRIRAKSLQNTGVQTVADWHPSKRTEGDGYFRHKAFFSNFIRLGNNWFLEVTPTYYFTSDGRTEYWNSETLLAGIKRLDRHAAVRGNLLLWRSVFTEHDLTKRYKRISFNPPLEFELNTGIDDKSWQRTGIDQASSTEDEEPDDNETEFLEDPNQTLLW